MTKQHTPGPWEVRIPFSTAARFPAYIVSSEPNERFIAAMYGSGGDYDKRLEAAQNARLIAAAPDLLEALQALTHSLDYADLLHDDQRKAFKHARAAVAKAGGAA